MAGGKVTTMLHEVKFGSFNERDTVYGWVYVPAAKPLGIIQLIHGFGEHSRRYLHMISSFVEAGYIVAADDHVGHGKTAVENGVWGDWGGRGYTVMVEDEKRLRDVPRASVFHVRTQHGLVHRQAVHGQVR